MDKTGSLLWTVFAALWCNIAIASDDMTNAPSGKPTIAILGTGDMGDSFGPRLAELGYPVIYGSRSPQSERVQALLERTGQSASAASNSDAANAADIVLVALAAHAVEDVMRNVGELEGKIIIDLTWPPSRIAADGYDEITIDTSGAERLQAWLPKAHVVKAFVTTASNVIDDPMVADGPVTVPIASDHRHAKEVAAGIAVTLGLDPVDAGPLRYARHLEGLAALYMVPHYQGRDDGWEFYFRRSNYWRCNTYTGGELDDDGPAPYDANDLAEMPQEPSQACR